MDSRAQVALFLSVNCSWKSISHLNSVHSVFSILELNSHRAVTGSIPKDNPSLHADL